MFISVWDATVGSDKDNKDDGNEGEDKEEVDKG
jgi:hypothetical protein